MVNFRGRLGKIQNGAKNLEGVLFLKKIIVVH